MLTEKLRGKLSYSRVVSTLALFVALGGTAYAVTELEKNEVRSKHIGKGQVKNGDLANDAVTSPKVANGSLLGEDFAAGQLPQGSQGERGPQGDKGEPGQNATSLFATVVDGGNGAAATLGPTSRGAVSVSDPAGANSFIDPYVVTFDRSLAGCVAQATQGRVVADGGAGLIAIMSADVSGSTVRLFAQKSTDVLEDSSFMVSVFC